MVIIKDYGLLLYVHIVVIISDFFPILFQCIRTIIHFKIEHGIYVELTPNGNMTYGRVYLNTFQRFRSIQIVCEKQKMFELHAVS